MEDVITGLEFLVDRPGCDPWWISRIKETKHAYMHYACLHGLNKSFVKKKKFGNFVRASVSKYVHIVHAPFRACKAHFPASIVAVVVVVVAEFKVQLYLSCRDNTSS